MFRAEERLLGHDGGPLAATAHREGPRAVRENGVGHCALQPVVEEVGCGADLHRYHDGAMPREGLDVVGRLLQCDHSARAARVAHVHPLDGRLESESGDDVGVEARTQTPRTGGGGEKVHVAEGPARALHRATRRLRPQLDGAAPKARAQFVYALRRRERLRIEEEVTAIDLTVPEESRAERIVVAGQAEERRLIESVRGSAGGDGHDLRRAHVGKATPGLLPCLSSGCYQRGDRHGKEPSMPLFSFEGKSPRVHPTAFIAPTANLIGDVTVEENASVWYNAVVRADFSPIIIRRGANVQDCAVIHVTPASGTDVAAGATVGHLCLVHAATLGEGCLVGNGSTVRERPRSRAGARRG